MTVLKVLLLGPPACGKSNLANFLADVTDNSGGYGNYRATQGLRILDLDLPLSSPNASKADLDVELWDCGGVMGLELCWPAMLHNLHGIVFVYNPSELSHIVELEKMYNAFVTQTGMSVKCCMLLALEKSSSDRRVTKLPYIFPKVDRVRGNIEEGAKQLLNDFNSFFSNVLFRLNDRNDQEELNIMNMQHH